MRTLQPPTGLLCLLQAASAIKGPLDQARGLGLVSACIPIGNSKAGNLPRFLQYTYDMVDTALLIIHKNVYAGTLTGQITTEKLPGEVELNQDQKRSIHAKEEVALGQRNR